MLSIIQKRICFVYASLARSHDRLRIRALPACGNLHHASERFGDGAIVFGIGHRALPRRPVDWPGVRSVYYADNPPNQIAAMVISGLLVAGCRFESQASRLWLRPAGSTAPREGVRCPAAALAAELRSAELAAALALLLAAIAHTRLNDSYFAVTARKRTHLPIASCPVTTLYERWRRPWSRFGNTALSRCEQHEPGLTRRSMVSCSLRAAQRCSE